MAVPPLIVTTLFVTGHFNYTILFCWALVGGTFAAFAQPARDALLNRVAGADVQRVVTLSVGVQFGVQIFGFAIGSSADTLGPPALLITMSCFMLAAAAATSRIPALTQRPTRPHQHPLSAIREGVLMAWRDPGHPARNHSGIFRGRVFFAGAYMVLLPLMVRDLYAGGSTAMAGTFAANMAGTVVVTTTLVRLGRIERPGARSTDRRRDQFVCALPAAF